jgi:hypothetical protein
MSEINAIATNNYLLAAQQEVSHDNTLSGNGTVDSPLGVVPGYNETVLWSGTLASGATAALSEPITAFERIGFAGYCHNGEVYSVYAEAPVISTAVHIAATTFWPGSPEFDLVKCECANTTAKSHGTSILYNGSMTNTNGTITKIVGINRKA